MTCTVCLISLPSIPASQRPSIFALPELRATHIILGAEIVWVNNKGLWTLGGGSVSGDRISQELRPAEGESRVQRGVV